MVIRRKFVRDQEKMKYWQSMIVLNYILNVRGKALPVAFDLDDDNKELEPLLENLFLKKKMLDIDNNQYVPTKLGREALAQFLEKYHEMNNAFGIFPAVCLRPVNRDAGETNFALEKLYELSECEFSKFRNDSKWGWEDLRFAVIEFKNSRITDPEKKIDPIEMVVMNFLEKNRFDYDQKGWQFDLRAGLAFDDIYDIAESLLGVKDLAYGDVTGEMVIEDIIIQGTEIMQKLNQKKLQLEKEEEQRLQRMKEEERLLEEERMQEEDRQWRQQRANSGYQEFVEYDYGERVVFRDLDPFEEVVVVRHTTVEYVDPFFVPPVLVVSIW